MTEALDALRRGDVVLIPTDTLVGLHVRADHPDALRRLAQLKGTSPTRPYLLLFADAELVWPHVEVVPELRDQLTTTWPAPLTALLSPRPEVPQAWTLEGRSIGVRVPDHTPLRALLREIAVPLFSTSANQAGQPPATNLDEARTVFPELVGIDLATPTADQASTIVDFTSTPAKVVRQGVVAWPPENSQKR